MPKLFLFVIFFCSLAAAGFPLKGQGLYRANQGQLSFKSDAPLELIEAASKSLRGVIDPAKRTFAFSVPVNTFQGFNSPLQREHFNENYMETAVYQEATFSGKIIEDIDLSVPGIYSVRAKGKLNVHGVEQERIIKSTVESKENALIVRSDFTVLLAEHNISIPRIVYQKIAEEIQVHVEATFSR